MAARLSRASSDQSGFSQIICPALGKRPAVSKRAKILGGDRPPLSQDARKTSRDNL